jgi:hypothetical protein
VVLLNVAERIIIYCKYITLHLVLSEESFGIIAVRIQITNFSNFAATILSYGSDVKRGEGFIGIFRFLLFHHRSSCIGERGREKSDRRKGGRASLECARCRKTTKQAQQQRNAMKGSITKGSGSSLLEGDGYLTKELSKLFHRIERILVPANSIVENTVGVRLNDVMANVKKGDFFRDTFPAEFRDYSMRTIDWDLLEPAILNALDYTAETIPALALEEIRVEQSVQWEKVNKIASKFRMSSLQVGKEVHVIVHCRRYSSFN